jgi:MFS family permease
MLLSGLTPTTYILTLIFSILGWLFYGPGANAYVLASAPKVSAGKYLGFFNSVASAGIVLSSITLAFVISWNARSIGFLLGGLLIAAFIAIRATPSPQHSVHAERKVKRHTYYVRRHFVWDLFKKIRTLNPASTLLMLQGFSGSLLYAAVWFVIPLVIASGQYQGLWGISLSVFDLAIVVLGSYLGRLADRSDHKRMVFYGLLLFSLAATILGFNLNAWFLLLGFLATAGDEMSSVSLWAWLDRLDEKHGDEGLINGAVMFFQDLAWTIGPIMAGFLYAQVGPAWTITAAALPIFVAWVVSAVFLGALPKTLWPSARDWAHEVPVRLRHKN